jgi:hypothetical protein
MLYRHNAGMKREGVSGEGSLPCPPFFTLVKANAIIA